MRALSAAATADRVLQKQRSAGSGSTHEQATVTVLPMVHLAVEKRLCTQRPGQACSLGAVRVCTHTVTQLGVLSLGFGV